MRLVIDAAMATPRAGGIGNYTANLIAGLVARDVFDIVALVPDRPEYEIVLPDPADNFRIESIVEGGDRTDDLYRRRVRWMQRLVHEYLLENPCDMFLGPIFTAPCDWPGPKVVTVHDLAFERSRSYNSSGSVGYYTRWARRCAASAAAVICVSHTTRADVEEYWGITRDVHVTHLAPCVALEPRDRGTSIRAVHEKLGVKPPFGLYLGSTHPRKNLARLIAAVARVESFGPSFPMVLAVPPSDELAALVRDAGVTDRVRTVGHCPDNLLPHLYASAEFLVYPSLFEGFGLPPLEAMACGTAVAASSGGSVPEVLQDSCLYFEPRDPDSIAATLRRLMRDRSLRDDLATRGQRHASRFSWDDTAARTALILKQYSAKTV